MSDLNASATKADIEQLRAANKADLHESINQLRDELKEAIHDSQTELLKAFYTFARSIEANLSDLEKSDVGIRHRLSIAKSRLTEIERRLNMPPAA